MKKYFAICMVLALGLTACENFFDEKQLGNSNPQVSDVRTGMTYTLTDDDYQTLTKYPDNIAKALALDPVDSTGLKELQAIAKEKAFTETASPDMYVPALMNDKYPYLDNGTTCDVFYTQREGKSDRIKQFDNAVGFELTHDDYETIWQMRGAYYLTPASLENMPAFLANKLPAATFGQIAMVTYQYSEDEPDPSEMHNFLPYELNLSDLLVYPDDKFHQIHGYVSGLTSATALVGNFTMVDGEANIKVYKLKDDAGSGRELKDKGVKNGDAITITGRYSSENGEPQIVDGVYVTHHTPNAGAPRRAQAVHHSTAVSTLYQLGDEGWAVYQNEQLKAGVALPPSVYTLAGVTAVTDPEIIRKWLEATYPYAADKETYLVGYMGKNGATADEWVVTGTEFVLSTGYITETMSFEVKNNSWIANMSTYLQAKFVGEGPGKFTIQHVTLNGLNYVWRYQAAYGMTASSYVKGTNYRVEDWLVSPNIRLKKAVQPRLTFDHAVRYGNVKDNPTWLSIMVTDNYTGDVTTTEWKKLEFNVELPDGSNWIFRSAGIYDLSEYNGKNIVIGFRYCNMNVPEGVEVPSAPTWELQNLLLAEPEEINNK